MRWILHPVVTSFAHRFSKQFLCLTGSIPLEIMEVQTVSYLGEDGIFRYKDTYDKEN